jgi:hypothetical protein
MAIKLFGTEVNLHPRFGNNFIDANTLDHTGGQEDAALDRILMLVEQGEFTLLLPYSVQREIGHPNTPSEVKRRAARLIYSMPVQLTDPEIATHERIRALIRGNAQSEKHTNDAFHIVESAKNGGRHFITNDRRLLKKAPQIWKALLIRVLTPSEFVADYYPAAESTEDNTMPIPKRETVTRDELNAILTREIRQIEDLEDAKLTFQYVLREPDETGCNWTGAVLNPGSKGSPEYGTPYAHGIVERARARYNIRD